MTHKMYGDISDISELRDRRLDILSRIAVSHCLSQERWILRNDLKAIQKRLFEITGNPIYK
jgi:hypothetical protein